MDRLAERVSSLGGVPLAAPHDVAEVSTIARPPKGRESVPAQITRLLDAHEQILVQSRGAAWEANENGDDGTNDLIVSENPVEARRWLERSRKASRKRTTILRHARARSAVGPSC